MSCSFYEDRGGMFSFSPFCLKKNDYVNSDVYEQYCRSYSYSDCPIYRNSSSGSSTTCYLTSACVYAKGLPDNCYELETLRRYRDGWLNVQDGGKELIKRYYEIAPKIVSAINDLEYRREIYEKIYENMVLPCVHLIEAGKNLEAMQLYKKITEELESTYCRA